MPRPNQPEWRLTRPSQYGFGTPGRGDLSAREGHYIHADTPQDAVNTLAARYPGSLGGYDVQPWRDATGALIEPTPVTYALRPKVSL